MEIEFTPPTINRISVMVTPKKPFYTWEASVFPGSPTTEDRTEFGAYLVQENDRAIDIKTALKHDWKWIFENELFGICTDESRWPKTLTWKKFTEWFEVKMGTIVLDLSPEPLIIERLE